MDNPDLIIKVLTAGAASEDTAVRQAYADLKSAIQKVFREKGDADGEFYLDRYEKKKSLEAPLKESLSETGADGDAGILEATQILGSQVGIIAENASVEGGVHFGNEFNAQAGTIQRLVQASNIGTVNIGTTQQEGTDHLRTAYLNHVLEEAGRLSLDGIDPKSKICDANTCLNLSSVYTALLTRSSEGEGKMPENFSREQKTISALDALNRNQRLVLLGDPGSGKTTFVNFVAMCMAGEALGQENISLNLLTAPLPDDEGDPGKEPQPWKHGCLLPVRIVLRDFAARGLPRVGHAATANHLWLFIAKELEDAALGKYADPLYQELQKKGGLLLLDGLDEVPEANHHREQIRQVVESFVSIFHKCRVLLTSRTYAYQQQNWRIPDIPETVLAPFSDGQIHCFVSHWYANVCEFRTFSQKDAKGRAVLLGQAIFGSRRLLELARRPLLLTLMASLHSWRGGSLPEKREELYADAVELLLDWWEKGKIVLDEKGEYKVVQPSLMEWLNTDRKQIRTLLNRLAFEAHAGQPALTGTADIPEDRLMQGLMNLNANPDVRPGQLIRHLSQRSGLLMPRGVGVYTFHHRTFQEYLTACHLTDHDFPTKIAKLARNEPERWREVTLLAGAKAAGGAEFAIWALARALCFKSAEKGEAGNPDIWGAQLAGQALAETAALEQVSEDNRPLLDRIRFWLLRIMEENLLPATERAIAGNSLSRLGDPRFDPEMFFLPNDEELGFVRIRAGEFVMGSDKKRDKYAGENETLHTVELSEYYIARYPVTVAQFRVFMKETGHYTDEDWERFNTHDTHPVVNVSWEDAVDYCKWLTQRLQEKGRNWQIRLPTEAQWEMAARGNDGRIYPWGDAADTDKANYDDTGIGTTSAVGCFPKGISPYGIADMAGNVLEWCHDYWYDKYPSGKITDPTGPLKGSARVDRGGGYFAAARDCRSADRAGAHPVNRSLILGFRLLRLAP